MRRVNTNNLKPVSERPVLYLVLRTNNQMSHHHYHHHNGGWLASIRCGDGTTGAAAALPDPSAALSGYRFASPQPSTTFQRRQPGFPPIISAAGIRDGG